MERTLMPLPYAKDALEPYVTGLIVEIHYERHHRGYLNRLLELVRGKPEANESLSALVRTASGEVFENAAQVWNHDLFWRSLKPGEGRPGGALRAAIERDFGSALELERRLVQVREAQFGGGWLFAEENLALAEPSYVEDPSLYEPQHRDLERSAYL